MTSRSGDVGFDVGVGFAVSGVVRVPEVIETPTFEERHDGPGQRPPSKPRLKFISTRGPLDVVCGEPPSPSAEIKFCRTSVGLGT